MLWEIFSVILALFVIAIVAKLSETVLYLSGDKKPPFYSGWWPFLGCAFEFGRGPLVFIEKCRQKMGPVFTLYIAGRRMTFLTDPDDYNKYFLQSEFVDFQKGVQPFVQNAASIDPDSFLEYHTSIHDMMKGKLALKNLPELRSDLQEKFDYRLQELRLSGSYELNNLVRSIMYPVVIKNLFGDEVLPVAEEAEILELVKNFKKFDDEFEYGTQLPQIFLRSWVKSKNWLLNKFDLAIQRKDSSDRPTVLQALYDTVKGNQAANYGLLMLWASLANAIPITYWTILYILNNKEVHMKIQKEISSVKSMDELISSTPYIKCCFLEAVRLRSPGTINRLVVKPFTVQGYEVPAGDMLFISPYWAHKNHDLFSDADRYFPERWLDADLEKNNFLPGFVAFGGGRYMCPGRWYALMELHMLLAMLFHRYDMTMEGSMPDPDILHLVGVQQPSAYVDVHFTPKKK